MTKEKATNEDQPAETKAVASTIGNLRTRMDHLFDDLSLGFPKWDRAFLDIEPFKAWSLETDIKMPAVDLVEQDGQYVIKAELPGVTEDDIDVDLSEGVLTVKGEKKKEEEREEDNVHISERRYGSFMRSFRLPPDADAENITATCKDGVVEVSIPRIAPPQPKTRKIEIKKK